MPLPPILSHQFDHYEQFLKNLKRIIDEKPIPLTPSYRPGPGIQDYHRLKFELIDFKVPANVDPKRAILENLTYEMSVNVRIHVISKLGGGEDHISLTYDQDVELCRIPVMVKSSVCPPHHHDDEGGYFIISGLRRALCLVQSKNGSPNRIQIFEDHHDKEQLCAFFNNVKITYNPKDNSVSCEIYVYERVVDDDDDDETGGKNQRVIKKIPIQTLLRILAPNKNYIQGMIQRACFTKASYDKIGSILRTPLKPQLQTRITEEQVLTCFADKEDKCNMILLMLGEMFLCYDKGLRTGSDFSNKRFETCGYHLETKFQQLFGKLSKMIQKKIRVPLKLDDLQWSIKEFFESSSSLITDGFFKVFSTGIWNPILNYLEKKKKSSSETQSICHLVDTYNKISSMTSLTKILNFYPDNLLVENRPHEYGYSCALGGPKDDLDSKKLLTISATITLEVDDRPILELIRNHVGFCKHEDSVPKDMKRIIQILVNKKWVGILSLDHKDELIRSLRKFRSETRGYHKISIYRDSTKIHVNTDAGRITRPVFTTEPFEGSSSSFDEFIRQGKIEWIDAYEQTCLYIAPDSPTHYEIDSSFVYGFSALTTIFPEHNASLRNIFQSNSSKQAMSFESLEMRNQDFLYYPDEPIISHPTNYMVGTPVIHGENTILAIMMHDGGGQEDSFIVNSRFIERGGLLSFYDKIYHTNCLEEEEEFFNPLCKIEKMNHLIKMYDFTNLDSQGIIKKGVRINSRTILMCKRNLRTNAWILIRPNHLDGQGEIHEIQMFNDGKDVKIRVRATNIPQKGDKLMTRHGQKGTIGEIVDPENLPFTLDGMIPDIIMNPCAFPSRMTIGPFYEALYSKLKLLRPDLMMRPFHEIPFEFVQEALRNEGCHPLGYERMISGETGEFMNGLIFTGPQYVQVLKHKAQSKVFGTGLHFRRDPYTRQAIAGRKNEGATMLGNMEKDCLIAHGANNVLLEKFSRCDPYVALMCTKCEFFGEKKSLPCRNCGHEIFDEFHVSYSLYLLVQEMMCLNIRIKFENLIDENEMDVDVDDCRMFENLQVTYVNIETDREGYERSKKSKFL